MRKRILALFLVLVMCLSLLPTAVFAEGDIDTTGGADGDTTITGSTGDTGNSTAAPTGKDEDKDKDKDKDTDSTVGAPTPLLSAASTPVVLAAGTHSHCPCGADHNNSVPNTVCTSSVISDWDEWSTIVAPTGGHIYLTGNVTLTETWEPNSNTYLCLNGYTITFGGDGPAIRVKNGVTFTLTDCQSTSGAITHAANKSGSGVYVEGGGTFNMTGGKISGNTAALGGGVYADGSSSFTMTGGSITGNTANDTGIARGGGVYANGSSSFTMTGGSITNNTVTAGTVSGAMAQGGGVFVNTEAITVDGSAQITGNKRGSSAETDNVYLFCHPYKVVVQSGFSGKVGINVDISAWTTIPSGETERIGKSWEVVGGDGGSAALNDAMITYDNKEFEVCENTDSTIKLLCKHYCAAAEDGKCSRCGSPESEAEVTFANGTKRCYLFLKTAISSADNGGTVKLLKSGSEHSTSPEYCLEPGAGNTVTLNLNGKTYNPNCSVKIASGTLIVEDSSLSKTGDIVCKDELRVASGATLKLNGWEVKKPLTVKNGGTLNVVKGKIDSSLTVENGGTLTFEGTNSSRPIIGTLDVKSGGKVTLKGVMFEKMTVADGVIADILAPGHSVFYYTYEGGKYLASLVNANTRELVASEITGNNSISLQVLENGDKHTCSYVKNDKGEYTCRCGRTCTHSSGVDPASKCNACKALMAAQVTKTVGGSEKTACFPTFNAAVDSAKTGGTDVTIKLLTDAEFEDTDGGANEAVILGFPCTLDLNGKTLTVKEIVTDGEGQVTTGKSTMTIASTVTIKNSDTDTTGTIDPGVYVSYYNSGAGEEEEGILTVEGNVYMPELGVGAGAKATLKGGKYGKITAPNKTTCLDFLPDGKAYFNSEDAENPDAHLVKGNVKELPLGDKHYYVRPHLTCTFTAEDNGICGCGRECPHSSVRADGTCEACQVQTKVARIEPRTGGGTAQHFPTLKAAADAAQNGDTITLLKAATVSDSLTIGTACTLDLNGKVLTIETEKKLTVSAAVTIKGAAGSQISGNGEVVAGASANLTIEGNPTIGYLTVTDASATVQLKGGTYGVIDASTASKKLASLLAPGYKFKSSTNNSDTKYSTAERDDGCKDIKVEQCVNHIVYGGTNNCILCNTAFAVDVSIGSATTYYKTLSDAMAYIKNYDPNDTTRYIYINLRGNVTEKKEEAGSSNKTITFDRCNPLFLFMNGNTLTADITVASGTTLDINSTAAGGTLNGTVTVESGGTVNIANGAFTKLDVQSGGNAKLSGGTFAEIVVAGTDKTVRSLPKSGYSYRSTEIGKAWVGSSSLGGTSLTKVLVQMIPITYIQVGLAASSGSTITYGDSTSTTTLTATAIRPEGVTAEPTYSWSREKVGGTTTSGVGSAATLTVKGSELDAGEYDFSCTVTVDGYSLESNVRITVNKATLSSDKEPTAKTGLTFQTTNAAISEPKPQQLVTAPTSLPTGCTVYYRLGTTGDFTTTIPTATNAGTYTVQWYITGNDNYYDTGSKTAPQSLTVEIKPMKVGENVPAHNPEGINQLSIKHWDSQRQIWCTDGTLTYTYTGEPIEPTIRLETPSDYVIPESGYSVEYKNNTIATTLTSKPTIIIKDTDPNDNFQIMESEFTFTIEPKTVELNPNTYTHYAVPSEANTIALDLTNIPKAMGMPTNDGPLEFELATGSTAGMSIVEGNYVTITNPSVGTIYTATIKVSSNNYRGSFVVKIHVVGGSSTDKTVLEITYPTIEKVYDGATLTAAQAGEQARLFDGVRDLDNLGGTWNWNAPEGKPTNVADSGYYLLTFTPTGDDAANYTSATKVVQVTINAKSLADSGITATADGGTYTGEPITPTNLTVTYKTADDRTLTLTEGTDYTVSGNTSKTDAGTYSLTITGKGNYTGTKKVEWTIAPCPVKVVSISLNSKTYDGTVTIPDGNLTASFNTVAGGTALPFTRGTDYTIADAKYAGAGAGQQPFTAKVTLKSGNYAFAPADSGPYTSTGGSTATLHGTGDINRAKLTITAFNAIKSYDGTKQVNGNTLCHLSISGAAAGEQPTYTIDAAFGSTSAGTTTVSGTLTLTGDAAKNYCFDDLGQQTTTTVSGAGVIERAPLTSPLSAKNLVVFIRQDQKVKTGSYQAAENLNAALPDGMTLSGEGRFTLGTLPDKVTANIDENGLLTYTITGGKAGDKLAIPVTFTLPNFEDSAQEGGAAVVALLALNDQPVARETGAASVTFTVEIELTGSAAVHHPHRWNGNLTGGTAGGSGSGAGSGNSTGSGSGVASPATGDAGIALYGVLAVLSLTGGAWIRRKKR